MTRMLLAILVTLSGFTRSARAEQSSTPEASDKTFSIAFIPADLAFLFGGDGGGGSVDQGRSLTAGLRLTASKAIGRRGRLTGFVEELTSVYQHGEGNQSLNEVRAGAFSQYLFLNGESFELGLGVDVSAVLIDVGAQPLMTGIGVGAMLDAKVKLPSSLFIELLSGMRISSVKRDDGYQVFEFQIARLQLGLAF